MNIFNTLLIAPLTNGLMLFYRLLFSNMGLGIIGFSLFLRFVLNPLTTPYMNSMKKMKDIEPLVNKLKKKYKGDNKKLMEVQAALYKEKGINPGAGCLPYLLQIVVLIALFNVFTTVLKPGVNGAQLNSLLYPPLKLAQDEKLNTGFLYLDITKPDTFRLPGINFSLPGPLLILAAIAQFLSAKIAAPFIAAEEKVAKKTKGEADNIQVAMQQSMTYTFPMMTIVFGLNFPSGLALYWLLFSVWQVQQQYRTSGWGGLTPLVNKARKLLNR